VGDNVNRVIAHLTDSHVARVAQHTANGAGDVIVVCRPSDRAAGISGATQRAAPALLIEHGIPLFWRDTELPHETVPPHILTVALPLIVSHLISAPLARRFVFARALLR
jgi:hypothetical protein